MLLVYFSAHSRLALVLIALVLILCIYIGIQAHHKRVRAGNEELIGMYGEVTAASNAKGKGRALIRGEIWQVYSATTLSAGQMIKVTATHGLLLDVEPVATQQEEES